MGGRSRAALFVTASLALIGAGVYLAFRLFTFLTLTFNPLAFLFVLVLLFGESFFILQTLGYNANLLRSLFYAEGPQDQEPVGEPPPVAIFVVAYNEPASVLDQTLRAVAKVRYPRKAVYLLDDSTDGVSRDGARRVALAHGAILFHRNHRRGFKAGAINDALKKTKEPFLAVLDADQRPRPEFLDELVPRLVDDPALAFVQTPQFYANYGESRVALAAEFQHVSFFEHVSEGKHLSNAMFFCGTNSLLRREALGSVGGFYEKSVTEDVATSFLLHMEGWKSLYYNRVLVEGEGPATLGAYFDQQYRWAVGSFSLLGTYIRNRLTRGKSLSRSQWREYFLSFTWWFVGLAQMALLWIPIAFLLFGIPILGADPLLYLTAALPFLVFPSLTYYVTLKKRGYSARGLWLSQALTLVTFPVYIRALLDVITGRRVSFGVTPKGSSQGRLPWRILWPQIAMFTLTFAAIVVPVGLPFHQDFLLVGVVALILVGLLGVWRYMGSVDRPQAEEYKTVPWSKLGAVAGVFILFVGVLGLLNFLELPVPEELQDLPQPRGRPDDLPGGGPPPWAGGPDTDGVVGNAKGTDLMERGLQDDPSSGRQPEDPPGPRDPFEPPPPSEEEGDLLQEIYRAIYPYLLTLSSFLRSIRDLLAVPANQAIVINLFWAFYNLLFLSGTFLFNVRPRTLSHAPEPGKLPV